MDTRRARMLAAVAVIVLAAAAVAALAAPARAAQRACAGYHYTGFNGGPATRVAATVDELRQPQLETGQLAAWVGVADSDRQWIQVGIAIVPHARQAMLYFEARLPGGRYVFRAINQADTGRRYRLAVEISNGTWHATVDGRQVGTARLTGPLRAAALLERRNACAETPLELRQLQVRP